RRMHTQVVVIGRTLMFIAGLIGAASALMTFESIREFGVSLLASAGIAGLILGLAARPTFENLIAGIQIALTQPIRLDDAVIVEGEWGWIEQITATYVVIKIWDERRLIVPFKRFIEEPFQNWTRRSADIIGTVTLHCDYTVPVAALRTELERLCKASERWDGRVCVLQMIDAKQSTVELRALVSAADSPTAWDLRCEIREALIDFIRDKYPHALPRVRATLDSTQPAADKSTS
ncbi:MAG: mechanosensitive ion channel domain-containing protein, partial [Planctomycetota bacterium]